MQGTKAEMGTVSVQPSDAQWLALCLLFLPRHLRWPINSDELLQRADRSSDPRPVGLGTDALEKMFF